MRQELSCKFCFKFDGNFVVATVAAPQYDGGDEGVPCLWVPVCNSHFATWYEDSGAPLPYFLLTDARATSDD